VSNPNGSDTYCKEINIMKPNAIKLIKDYGLTLSPNPRQDYLLLNVKENCPKALQMSISDTQGKIMDSSRIYLIGGFTTIDVRNIPSGSYFMILMDEEGGQEVLQFVKM